MFAARLPPVDRRRTGVGVPGPEDLDYLAGERTRRPTAAERREEAEGLTRPLGDPDEAAHRHAHRKAAAPVAGGTLHVPVQPGPQDREHLPDTTTPVSRPGFETGAAEVRDPGIPPPQARG
ncbi:hypothetical protein [Streptomyces sp. Tu6071]|uniref:hypothetical protein n=1 Tax=Streptomyces sp. Tu6071 TaxID=355249 RepID=UPI0002FD4B16|nr:hypothetical protein [Streptomyces sp. Tu6071]